MSQQIGLNYKTKIPTFSDDASIEEALKVYHFGVDNYTGQSIPNESIEGHFLSLNNRVAATETSISQLSLSFIEEVSSASDPNEITPETSSIIPLNIKGLANQVAPLQRWQSVSSSNPSSVITLASIFPNGAASFAGYGSIGNSTQSVTTALNVEIGNNSHKGIIVKASSSQSANLQEWQNSSASVLAKVDSTGAIFSNNIQVVTLTQSQTLTNKTLTSPTISTPTITNGTITNASSITLSGAQDNSSRVRNITFSTGDPTGGNDGDMWIKYV